MIYTEDQLVKVNGVVLPGLVKSIEVKESAKIDEQEVEGSATKPKQATGYEDAKVNIELILDDTPTPRSTSGLRLSGPFFGRPASPSRSRSPSSARTRQSTASTRCYSRASPTRARSKGSAHRLP
ncbi:MAG: hypothetical protein ACLVL7_10830 [Anaerotruncus massiliensis (ex Togo et al. 2019)]